MSSSKEDRANADLINAVRKALWRSVPLRALNLDQLEIEVHGDSVQLRGVVASPALKYVAEQAARSVPGVDKLVSLLITDEILEQNIALALASDPSLRRLRIAVNATGGIASLYGAVASEEEAEACRDLALGVPGVVGVESKLHILRLGQPIILSWQRSMEGRPVPEVSDAQADPQPDAVEQDGTPSSSMNIRTAPAEA